MFSGHCVVDYSLPEWIAKTKGARCSLPVYSWEQGSHTSLSSTLPLQKACQFENICFFDYDDIEKLFASLVW